MRKKYQKPTIEVFRLDDTSLLISVSSGGSSVNNYGKGELKPVSDGDDYSGYDE
jgi:hypothetical protein